MNFVIKVILGVILIYEGSMVSGWASIQYGKTAPRPFNWRIFISPWHYYRWIVRSGYDTYK